jgi:hypothetical protein
MWSRDVLLDPGGTTMPRMTALHMLRSTISTVSAPANSSFRGSITHPTQPLCTLRVRRYRRLTQHSLPGGLLGLTWAGLTPADRASFAGAFVYSITSSARASSIGDISSPSALAVVRLMMRSNLVGCSSHGLRLARARWGMSEYVRAHQGRGAMSVQALTKWFICLMIRDGLALRDYSA